MTIYIKKSPSADSRTAKEDVAKEQLLESSMQHIDDVQKGLAFFAGKLYEAGLMHDHTKIEAIDGFYDAFSQYRGEEFKEQPWYRLHVGTERHHFDEHIPEDVTLIDILESITDRAMAGMGRGKIGEEQIWPDNLTFETWQRAYENTLGLLLREIEVIEDVEELKEANSSLADKVIELGGAVNG